MLRGHKTSCNKEKNSYRTEQNISLIWHITGTIFVLLEVTNLKVCIYIYSTTYFLLPSCWTSLSILPIFCCSNGRAFPLQLLGQLQSHPRLSTEHSDYICLLQMIIFPSASQLQIPTTVYPSLNLFFIEFHQHKAIVNTSV